ncbi:zinc finger A20 and AN1 domain-containing stress-associated protein 1-like isoform X3 [Phoenix dactylifera]|uniref:Zinc finger A20 and AN1 domain-containing stress-associated protein 1-like isoform X2 n=1 Tax=Phoenix dactylifera TaxID=42345 RepID=A0A8B8ZQ72_PHODC|nr:zinc finger A20 and AN1 domain-containing stress-associated protein 1-like isoform X2 [Phoenix dactylifera]XP_038976382.1 zinc finger A20 and AN1 domain-containing stress-associated protein 1-like isoform X3 [Phoenix dactylifera]
MTFSPLSPHPLKNPSPSPLLPSTGRSKPLSSRVHRFFNPPETLTLTPASNRRREMAQREKELQVPETLTLCVNNCGFASPSPPSRSSHEKASSAPARSPDPAAEAGRGAADAPAAKADAATAVVSPVRRVSRCAGCRKRVGLTGFRCRCGSREGSQ